MKHIAVAALLAFAPAFAGAQNPAERCKNHFILEQPCARDTGGTLAFVSERDGNPEIYVMNADGSNPIRLTNSPAEDLFPYWSPDGTRIAFFSHRDGNSEVYVMNADGSNQVNLSNNRADDEPPASWSADGTKILFNSNRDGNYEIYVMNLDGSGVTRLTDNPADDFSADWQP